MSLFRKKKVEYTFNGDGSQLQFTSSKISNVSVLELKKFSEVSIKLRSNLGLHNISF